MLAVMIYDISRRFGLGFYILKQYYAASSFGIIFNTIQLDGI